ncbi:MurR/RpiR family transcriptional regulator [Robertmurraya sp. DFI.2.37]|uniref:MurR/RpiR family transcriptional regulator n=1 Tax=Robertmurraya sp. DFI.2.37 TaxID=3031819 RepID=UPI00124526E3|nr:MurR/RpiR family transcriptional regulator [Robertmurraya sp. DFI.2.37]MDF1508000.1 MurR/RpiR family transcriptional regulator [Robertmurraya sp. DFI.2.37]
MRIEDLLRENYQNLSKGQKKVADLLLRDVVGFSMSTASQIAKQAEVSETTVIRLSYALDFESFSQMQKQIQKEYLLRIEQHGNSIGEEPKDHLDFIDTLIEQEIEILTTLRSKLDINQYWQAIDEIMTADEVHVVGYRASYPAAYWLYLKLNMLRKNVYMISSKNSYPEDLLIEQNKKIVFIFISFPRYVAQSLEIAETVKEQGAKLITITDHPLSPISRISNISFITQIHANSENFIPISSVLSLLNIITTGIEKKYEREVMQRVERIQNIYQEKDYFLE